MKDETPNLRNMVKDLFQAKADRRRRLADLPFEEKIEIVKRLQSIYPLTQVGFGTLVNDLLAPISVDLGIHISPVSPAMIPSYLRGQWLYDINSQYVVTIKRWLTGKEVSVQGWDDSDFKPRLNFGAELRAAIDSLRTESHELSKYDRSDARWRQKLPMSFLSFEAANGVWIAEWFFDPVLTADDDHVFFDIKFNRDNQTRPEKRLQIQIQIAAFSEDATQNLLLIEPQVFGLLEGPENLGTARFGRQPDFSSADDSRSKEEFYVYAKSIGLIISESLYLFASSK